MFVMKPCKCGSGVRLQKASSRGKYWVECNCCWESSDKFWTIEEAVNDWNNHIEKMEKENNLCD